MAKHAMLIIDEFLPDVDKVRSAALAEEYFRFNGEEKYSAIRATPDMIESISNYLGVGLLPAAPDGTGRYSCRLEGEKSKIDIHVDDCDWGGVLYLNLPEQCQGGTTLWRHKATGLDMWPNLAEQAKLKEKYGIQDLRKFFFNSEGLDRTRWEPAMTIPMKYNRLVLFQGRFFHSPAYGFGNSLENGRLTQVLFFNEK